MLLGQQLANQLLRCSVCQSVNCPVNQSLGLLSIDKITIKLLTKGKFLFFCRGVKRSYKGFIKEVQFMLIKAKPGDKGLQGLGVTGNCRLIRFFFGIILFYCAFCLENVSILVFLF